MTLAADVATRRSRSAKQRWARMTPAQRKTQCAAIRQGVTRAYAQGRGRKLPLTDEERKFYLKLRRELGTEAAHAYLATKR
jgi:hypothetical protein